MRLAILLGCVLLMSAPTAQTRDATDLQLQNRLQAHLGFLADDLLRGRQPGSRGYDIAANYVSSQFRQFGLLPAGGDGGFFQQVPLRRAYLEEGSAGLVFSQDGKSVPLDFPGQFYIGPDLMRRSTVFEAGLVFAGYGIEAAELGHDDYAGLDVNGKIVVLFAGQPYDFPSEEGAHFSSGMEKARAAARHGAVGIITIYTPRAAERYDWERLTSQVGAPSMGWINARGQVHGELEAIRLEAMIRNDAAAMIFQGAPMDLETLLARDGKGETLPVFGLRGRVGMRQRSTHESITSPNVVAMLPGSDPLLANEYVVFSAHLDHIGVLPASGEDTAQADLINNGALDNASGVAVLLESARLLSEGPPPRRSIIFLAVTAEEKGLVGSEYFAMNPTVPVRSIVAAVNLDMPLLLYDFADVIAFGAEHSSLGDTVRQAAQSFAMELSPDPFPEQNIFVRSDHYRFVQQGIPSIFLVTGMKSADASVDAQAIFEDFLKQHYHKPSDDINLPINYAAAAKFTRVNAKIGEMIANEPTRPGWREGDFFGRIFSK